MATRTIYLGAGCFWGVQSSLDALEGVLATEVGYAGGEPRGVSYERVCRKDTGHAEVVRVEFDDERLPLPDLLEHFLAMHDPTSERVGRYGGQYRSTVMADDPELRDAVRGYFGRVREAGRFGGRDRCRLTTLVEEPRNYTAAEERHQKYYEKHASEKKLACGVV